MEGWPIHGNLRYTGYFSGPNFGLVKNCRHLNVFVIVFVITSSRYPFFNKVFFIKSCSSTSLGLEQIIKARWTKVFIKLILRLGGQNYTYVIKGNLMLERVLLRSLTFDLYHMMLSVKQGGIKYHFLSLWYDSTWNYT